MTEPHTHVRGWHVFDLLVIGCVGVIAGLLLAALVAQDRPAVPDTPAQLVDE